MNDRVDAADREFSRERELTGIYRDALDAFSDDIVRIVREEVAAARPAPEALEDLVRRVARDEVGHRLAAAPIGAPWGTAGLAAAIVIAFLGAAWGVTALAGGGADPGGVTIPATETTVAAPDSVPAASLPDPPPPTTARDLAARFDSLFTARDPRLLNIAARAPSSGLSAAVDDWAAGGDGDAPVVYNVLVQLALRALVDSTLTVDGAILREPECRGETCGALLDHWRSRRDDPRYPPIASNPAADSDGIAQVERILILRYAGVIE